MEISESVIHECGGFFKGKSVVLDRFLKVEIAKE
jgi:hypothetical protein